MSKRKPKGPRVEVVDLDEVSLDGDNVRVHPERNRAALGASIGRFGLARSGVIDKDGVIRAGNGTVEAARAAGVSKAIVVDADGDQVVLVRRKDWTEEEAKAYAITDNRASDLSEFDWSALGSQIVELNDAGIDLVEGGLGWEPFEIEPLLEDGGDSPAPPPSQAPPGDPGFDYEQQHGVIVLCADESEQQKVYERFRAEGLECRVVSV